MAGYTVTIKDAPISLFIEGHLSEEDAFLEACYKIQELCKTAQQSGIRIIPQYRKATLERHCNPDPRD